MGFQRDYLLVPRRERVTTLSSLATTGELPHDRFWNNLRLRRDAHPARFQHFHHTLSPLLERDFQQRQGLLNESAPLFPNSPYFQNLYHRIAVNQHRFDHYHPFLSDLLVVRLPVLNPPVFNPPVVGSHHPETPHVVSFPVVIVPPTSVPQVLTPSPPVVIAAVPEPSTIAMAATAGLFGLVFAWGRRKRAPFPIA